MIERIKLFLAETRTELKKVTWPTREELKESTIVVIVSTFIVTVFVGRGRPDHQPRHPARAR